MKNFTHVLFAAMFCYCIAPALSMQRTPAALRAEIQKVLARSYRGPFKIEVNEPGIVTIAGSVPTYWDWLNVFALVFRVQGITEILNRLAVDSEPMAEDRIRAEIVESLAHSGAIENSQSIAVLVQRGEVRLQGSVHFPREKSMVEDIVASQRGVRGVENELEVQSTSKEISDENLAAAIRERVSHEYPLEAQTVQVSVENGRLALRGTTRRLFERRELEREILKIWGVRHVDNEIKVAPASS